MDWIGWLIIIPIIFFGGLYGISYVILLCFPVLDDSERFWNFCEWSINHPKCFITYIPVAGAFSILLQYLDFDENDIKNITVR